MFFLSLVSTIPKLLAVSLRGKRKKNEEKVRKQSERSKFFTNVKLGFSVFGRLVVCKLDKSRIPTSSSSVVSCSTLLWHVPLFCSRKKCAVPPAANSPQTNLESEPSITKIGLDTFFLSLFLPLASVRPLMNNLLKHTPGGSRIRQG